MARPKPNTNPKKKNRLTDDGYLDQGVRLTREARKRLFAAQRAGESEEMLGELRNKLKECKAAAKE